MASYKEIFDRIPAVEELENIKNDLQNKKEFNDWQDYYWAVKNICVYDTNPCDTEIIVESINNALRKGLSVQNDIRTYLDAIKILVTLYSQSGNYDLAIEALDVLLNLNIELPDWVYHYYAMAEIRTQRIQSILSNPYDFLVKLSHNSNNSPAVVRRQRNIFKQFLVEAERFIEFNEDVDINVSVITDAAANYGIENSDGWKIFESSITDTSISNSNDADSSAIVEKSDFNLNRVKALQSALFDEEEVSVVPNRLLERKYADVINKLEKLEREMETKRHELEENTSILERLNQENEELISHAQQDKDKRQKLLLEIQKQQDENNELKNKILEIEKSKNDAFEKVQRNPLDAIVGNVHLYLHTAQGGLSAWLNKYLPQSVGDWWKRAVLDSLSYEQRERAQEHNYTMLAQFDLAALLRIMSRNWRRLSQIIFLNQSEYECLQEMFNVRNRWAHMNTNLPEIEDIKYDLDTIADFMTQVGCSRQSIQEVRDYRNSI